MSKKTVNTPNITTYIEENIEETINSCGDHEVFFVCADGYRVAAIAAQGVSWKKDKPRLKAILINQILECGHPIR